MEHKYDVFISYSRKDTRTVDKICEAFDANGITYFIDRAGIGGGLEFPAVLANAIKSSKLFLFIASKNSYDSKFTQSEVVFAFNRKEKGEIIPYIIDGSSLPEELELTFSAINWRNIKDHPIETVLINDINSKLGRESNIINSEKGNPPSPAPKPNYLKYILGVLAVALGVVIGVVMTGDDPAQEEPIPSEEVVVEPVVVQEEVTVTSKREEQESIAEEQRKREQAEADRKAREEQERIAEEQRKREQAEADRKQREEQERIAEEQRKRNETTKRSGTINGHDWVDLGLSVKWATCNVGASQPHGYGNYYAWGETTTKSEYTSDNSRTYGKNMSDIRGNSNYDVARSNWGGSWRLPTIREMEELKNRCTWTWTSQSGIKGCKVTGPNGNSIFLPAAGYCDGSSRNLVGESGDYWSSTPDESNTSYACDLGFTSGFRNVYWLYRYGGLTVRPVSK